MAVNVYNTSVTTDNLSRSIVRPQSTSDLRIYLWSGWSEYVAFDSYVGLRLNRIRVAFNEACSINPHRYLHGGEIQLETCPVQFKRCLIRFSLAQAWDAGLAQRLPGRRDGQDRGDVLRGRLLPVHGHALPGWELWQGVTSDQGLTCEAFQAQSASRKSSLEQILSTSSFKISRFSRIHLKRWTLTRFV